MEVATADAKSEFEFLVGGSGGGARWNKALSCASVSRIRAVMSCVESSAFVKIFGPWKGSSAIEFEHNEICSRWEESREAMLKKSCGFRIASIGMCTVFL